MDVASLVADYLSTAMAFTTKFHNKKMFPSGALPSLLLKQKIYPNLKKEELYKLNHYVTNKIM